ncbi:alpha-D-xyloside xylohydrolase [Oscillospiraceae bacterium]|nr:alpha-D-xyloside xylohydrolase [Oscillospiraceae bacterium]
MRFTDGAWMVRDGFDMHKACEIRFIKKEEDKLVLTVPTYKIYGKGMTLGGVFLTIEITSPIENVFRVRTYHHKGDKSLEPSYFDIISSVRPLDISEEGSTITAVSGDSSLAIDKENFSMKLYRGGKLITASEGGSLAYIDGSNGSYMREQLSLRVGEHVYGLGERFGAFIRNGQSVDIVNKDGGTFSEQSYKNIPFYITDNDLGVFVNHSETVSFEVASENVSKVQFSVKGECLDYYLIAGSSMKDVLTSYTAITGRAPLLPEWSYGLWLSTSFLTDYDEKTVLSFVDGMLERGIDLKVFHFDCLWMKDSHWCNFIWDEDMFPDAKALIEKIHQRGIKVCVWINSYIAQQSELFDEADANGYLIKKTDGSTWQTDMWQPGMGIVDFTNPSAKAWYLSKLKSLLDMGVDCFKTDFGERIPMEDVVYFGGQDPERMHNFYTYLYNEAVYSLILKEKGEGEAILFARSATAGGQKFPVHWGGDCKSDYVSMEQTIRGGLSLMLSGFSYWSHDIGGFEDKSTADVYKRWAAFGLMSSHSRLHGSTSYRVPWNYDDEAVEVVRFYTELKKKFLPKILEASSVAHETGVPVMRPMVLEFQEDPVCAFLDRQYMLGSDILVAPVFDETGYVEYYLPAGTWKDVYTDETITLSSGKVFKETRDHLHMPIFVRG